MTGSVKVRSRQGNFVGAIGGRRGKERRGGEVRKASFNLIWIEGGRGSKNRSRLLGIGEESLSPGFLGKRGRAVGG